MSARFEAKKKITTATVDGGEALTQQISIELLMTGNGIPYNSSHVLNKYIANKIVEYIEEEHLSSELADHLRFLASVDEFGSEHQSSFNLHSMHQRTMNPCTSLNTVDLTAIDTAIESIEEDLSAVIDHILFEGFSWTVNTNGHRSFTFGVTAHYTGY